MKSVPFTIGILSDTHGPVPKPARDALSGVHHIIHAGDVVDDTVVTALRRIAPTTVVRGNMDGSGLKDVGPKTEYITLDGIGIYILHDLYQLDIDPGSAGVTMVVHGHTHRAKIEWKNGVLYLNPGSATSPRGNAPPSVAKVVVTADGLKPELVYLPLL